MTAVQSSRRLYRRDMFCTFSKTSRSGKVATVRDRRLRIIAQAGAPVMAWRLALSRRPR